jgi:thiosulfate/3-mercaptopyruvate sulfurtransferase
MSQYATPEVLVDTHWLLARLDDPTVRIVEVDLTPDSYRERHLPGAIFWHIFSDLLLPNLRQNLDPIAIANLLSRAGIAPDTTVIAYGSIPDTGAWIFWLLKLCGHDNVVVLNGGYKHWLAAELPVTSEVPTYSPTPYLATSLDPSLRVSTAEVLESLGRDDRVLLDVRSVPEYQGEIFMQQPPTATERAGHIPGAVNLSHLLALNQDGTFKSAAELRDLYTSQGITPGKQIFTYCAIGARSACSWFVLKYLMGYPTVRNYDGSWNEWSRMPAAPIEGVGSRD